MIRQMYDPINGVVFGFDDSIISSVASATIQAVTYTKQELDTKLSTVLKLCGSKQSVSELPSKGEVGDVWIIEDESSEYAWIKAGRWEKLGPVINLVNYVTNDRLAEVIGTIPNPYSNVSAYIQAVATVANAAVTTTAFNTFLTSNSQAIAAAKKAGDDAQTTVDDFKQAQLVFEAAQENIESLTNPTTKSQTADTYFSRRKTYYKKVNDEYVALVIGTDYEAMGSVADYDGTVYEEDGISVQTLINKINELVTAGNLLISAHRQAVVENNQEGE